MEMEYVLWGCCFSVVKSEIDVMSLPSHGPATPPVGCTQEGILLFLFIIFPFQEHIEDKQYPQKCQDPLLSHLQPLSPGQTHGELKRYYSICQDTALRHPGFPEAGGGMSRVERTRNSLSPTMAPKLSLEVRKLSNGRLSTSLKLGPLQPRGVLLREKKATQMVAIVLGKSELLIGVGLDGSLKLVLDAAVGLSQLH